LGKGVADVQRALARLGYDPGKADGVLGPRTRRAIEAYQRAHGRTADGRPTLDLLNALRDSVARAGK
jgi:peptidoglycan hydrolase-like protein with peptidoglycan-binding domain